MKTGSNLPRRAVATGLAACAHLLVLLLLGWKIPRLVVPSRRDDAPALQITLVRPDVRLRGGPSTRQERPARAPAASARILTQPAPQAPVSAVTPPKAPAAVPEATPAPVPPNFETNPGGDQVRSALRGLIGCTGALAQRLSHEERAACEQKLAAAKPAAVGPLYTPKEAEAFNTNPAKESIFVRKPHNECLPHIGSLPPAGGAPVPASGAATTGFGIACAWSFW